MEISSLAAYARRKLRTPQPRTHKLLAIMMVVSSVQLNDRIWCRQLVWPLSILPLSRRLLTMRVSPSEVVPTLLKCKNCHWLGPPHESRVKSYLIAARRAVNSCKEVLNHQVHLEATKKRALNALVAWHSKSKDQSTQKTRRSYELTKWLARNQKVVLITLFTDSVAASESVKKESHICLNHTSHKLVLALQRLD